MIPLLDRLISYWALLILYRIGVIQSIRLIDWLSYIRMNINFRVRPLPLLLLFDLGLCLR